MNTANPPRKHSRGRRDLRRFRDGESCDECPARRWYAESGFRYCENGHRIEVGGGACQLCHTPIFANGRRQGFVEFQHEDEGNFGARGHTARKEKEVKEKIVRQLSGAQARELYLECLQLVLRKQISWLVGERHFPVEFETVVRDLWDLRLRNFHGLKLTTDTADGSGYESSQLYSSQDESAASDSSAKSSVSRARSWKSGIGERWNLPSLFDTLGLCYLGCLLLRLPYRIGDFYQWAKKNQILFLGAVSSLRA